MATQNVDILQVNTAPSVKSISDLKKEIKDLKGQLLSLEQGTKEYNDVLVEVADKTHQLKEVQEQVSKSSQDFGDRVANVRGTVMGLTGAFQAVLGSLSLMGVNLGDDVKMLKMLNSAMAITQGVAAIDSGVKAFKALTISIKASTMAMSGLKKALITSGIGAAAVAVGILVTKLMELKEKNDEAKQSMEDMAAAMERVRAYTGNLNSVYLSYIELLEYQGRLEQASGKDTVAVNNMKLASLKARLAQEKVVLDNARAYEASVRDAQKEEAGKMVKDQQAVVDDISKRILAIERDTQVERTRIATEEAKKRAAIEGQPAEGKMQVQINVGVVGGTDRPLKEQKAQEAELQALTDYYTKRAEIVIANEKDIDDQLLALDIEYRDTREELLRKQYEDGLITRQDFDNQMAQLEVEAAEFQIEQEERVTAKIQEEAEKRKAAQKAWAQSVKVVASSVSSILGTLGDNLEEGTRQWKNLKTAQAIIDTIAGSVTAFMTTLQQIGGIPGLIAGAAAAAATLAAGMVEVNKIQSTNVSKNSAPSASGGSSLGSVSASAVSVNAMQVTPTRQVQTQEDVANLPDTRVYVLERDITDTQRRVAVTTQNATY
jgi:hypothetical protein